VTENGGYRRYLEMGLLISKVARHRIEDLAKDLIRGEEPKRRRPRERFEDAVRHGVEVTETAFDDMLTEVDKRLTSLGGLEGMVRRFGDLFGNAGKPDGDSTSTGADDREKRGDTAGQQDGSSEPTPPEPSARAPRSDPAPPAPRKAPNPKATVTSPATARNARLNATTGDANAGDRSRAPRRASTATKGATSARPTPTKRATAAAKAVPVKKAASTAKRVPAKKVAPPRGVGRAQKTTTKKVTPRATAAGTAKRSPPAKTPPAGTRRRSTTPRQVGN
jgi:hypothetical protein